MKKKRSGYFSVSLATLRTIASEIKDFNVLAGFLVLARHGTGRSIANRPPYTFTGAGRKSIKDKLGFGENRAGGIFKLIEKYALIQPVPENIKKAHYFEAQYELLQEAPDLDLPHSFVDGLGDTADSPLRRCKDLKISDEEKLDTLMLLIEMYAETALDYFGGIHLDS